MIDLAFIYLFFLFSFLFEEVNPFDIDFQVIFFLRPNFHFKIY